MRLIDADALANYANNQIVGITANEIMRFSTIDAEPVKHGHFERFSDDEQFKVLQEYGIPFNGVCSICSSMMFDTDKFCAECGAKMDLKDGESE